MGFEDIAGTRNIGDPTAKKDGLFQRLWNDAFDLNSRGIVELARSASLPSMPSLCDLGCGDGAITAVVASAIGASRVTAVEVYEPFAVVARGRNIEVVDADLNGSLPFPDGAFDIVVSNQVIEHLYDTERFVAESVRITKPGGAVILSTENAASWHNVGALVLGWQPFSLTNVSTRVAGVGNPLAIHRGGEGWVFPMQHHRIFSLRGLREVCELEGLRVQGQRGSGYHPLPAALGRHDPTHAHFITVLARKPPA